VGKHKFRRLAYVVVGVLANIFRVAEATAGVADIHIHWRGYQPYWPEQIRYSDPMEPLAFAPPPVPPTGPDTISILPASLRDEAPPPPGFFTLALTDCGSPAAYRMPPEPPPPYVAPKTNEAGLTAEQAHQSAQQMDTALSGFHLTNVQDTSVRQYLGQGKFEITELPINGGVNLILRDPKTHEYRGDAFVKPGPDGSIVVSKTTGNAGFDTSKKVELPYSPEASEEAKKVMSGSESLNTFEQNRGKLGDQKPEGEKKEPDGKDIFVPVVSAEAKGEYGAVSQSHAVFQADGDGYEYGLRTNLAEGGAEGSVGVGGHSQKEETYAGAKGSVGANALKVEVFATYFSAPKPDGEGGYTRDVVGASGEAHTTLAEIGAKLGCSDEKGCGAGWSLGLLGIGTGMSVNYNLGQKLKVETEGAIPEHGIASTPQEIQEADQALEETSAEGDEGDEGAAPGQPPTDTPTTPAPVENKGQGSGEDDTDDSDEPADDADNPPPQGSTETKGAEPGGLEPFSQNPAPAVDEQPLGPAPVGANSALDQAKDPNWDGAARRGEAEPVPVGPAQQPAPAQGEPNAQTDEQPAPPDQQGEPDQGPDAGDANAQPDNGDDNQSAPADDQGAEPDQGAGDGERPNGDQTAPQEDQTNPPDQSGPADDSNTAQPDDSAAPSDEQPTTGSGPSVDPEAVEQRKAYNAAVQDGSAEALQHFLDEYPDSSYDNDVKDRMDAVENPDTGDSSSTDDNKRDSTNSDKSTDQDDQTPTDEGGGTTATPPDDGGDVTNPDDEKKMY